MAWTSTKALCGMASCMVMVMMVRRPSRSSCCMSACVLHCQQACLHGWPPASAALDQSQLQLLALEYCMLVVPLPGSTAATLTGGRT